MKTKKLILLLSLSTILLILPWYESFSGLFILFAFVPLLMVEDYYYQNRERYRARRMFLLTSPVIFFWNIACIWWVWNASPLGPVAATLAATFVQSGLIWLFHITRRQLGTGTGYFALLVLWTWWDFFYFHSEASFPWLTLGHAFANDTALIQWYEYTGVVGGSAWVMLCNIMFYRLVKTIIHSKQERKKKIVVNSSTAVISLIVPIIISLSMYYNHEEKGKDVDVVVIQPNIDPYGEKFDGLSPSEQVNIMLRLADKVADQDVDFFVGPETALQGGLWENRIQEMRVVEMMRDYMKKYPDAEFIVGADSYYKFKDGEPTTPTTRTHKHSGYKYEAYNSAFHINHRGVMEIYHKSKLVIGVEMLPYPEYIKFFTEWSVDLGGTAGGLGSQENREVFYNRDSTVGVAPVICYESVYGEFLNEYIKEGASLIFVVTNDGWWGNTPGYRQHLSFSRLRAIETRRSIARSANTGITCFINQRGDVLQATNYWEPDVIRGTIKANEETTFYVRNGDYIGRTAGFFTIITLLWVLVRMIMRRQGKTSA
jgi:apolipoprotein N-acyltransferase